MKKESIKVIASIIIPTNAIIVPLYCKYLSNIATPSPEKAKRNNKKPLIISENDSFKYFNSFLIHDMKIFKLDQLLVIKVN